MYYRFSFKYNGKEQYIDIEKYGVSDFVIIAWCIDGEIEYTKKNKSTYLKKQNPYELINTKNLRSDVSFAVLARLISLTIRKGRYFNLYGAQTYVMSSNNLERIKGMSFVEHRPRDNHRIGLYFGFYLTTEKENTEYHEELEKYYNDGLIYKISYRINNQPGHIYCLGSKVICENEIDTSSIEPIINKVRQRYLNPANEPL